MKKSIVFFKYRPKIGAAKGGGFDVYIPFATISEFIVDFLKGNLAAYIFIYNILGNVVAMMPFGFFLPLLFRRQEKFKNFFLTMVGIVIAIELLQFVTFSGSCDIDDVILNVLGACIMYGLLQIRVIRSLIRRIFLLEKAMGKP